MNWDRHRRKSVFGRLALACALVGTWPQVAVPQTICPPQIQWQQSFGAGGLDDPFAIRQTADGGYIVGGILTPGESSSARGNITSTNYGNEDFLIVRLDAQGQKLWDRSFGGDSMDILYALQQTTDGGFIMGGLSWGGIGGNKSSPSYGSADFWVVRTDASGNKLWDRSFGGSSYDSLRSLQQTSDGGFVLGGFSVSPADGNKTSPNFGNDDFWVIRLDANGNKLWERTFGESDSDALFDLKQTSDGGFVLVGGSQAPQGDYWVVRIDANGNQIWDKFLGGGLAESASSVLQTSDGGFLVGGYALSSEGPTKTSPNYGASDYWIVRLDSNGNYLWDRSFGGWNWEELHSLAPTSDGGFLLTGISPSEISGSKQSPYFGDGDAWLIRVDQNGDELWELSLGGSSYDVGRSAQQTRDGGFIVAVRSQSKDGNKTSPGFGDADFWIVKLAPENANDCDNDGVPNEVDQCPDSSFGAIVDSRGCAIDQLCPCKDFDTHNQYISCVKHTAADFQHAGFLTSQQRQEIVAQAIAAKCPPPVFSGVSNIAFGLLHFPIEPGVPSVGSGDYSYVSVVSSTPYTMDPYGVSVLLGEADSGIFFGVGASVYDGADPAWFLDIKAYGAFKNGPDGLIASGRGTHPGSYYFPVGVDLSPLKPSSVTIQYLCGGIVQSEETFPGPLGSFVVASDYYVAPRFNPFWRMPDGSVGALLELLGGCTGAYPYDQIFVRADNPTREVNYVSRVDGIAGGGLQEFSFWDELVGMFNRQHRALGNVLLTPANGRLTLTPTDPTDSESLTGVIVGAQKATQLELDLSPLELASESASLEVSALTHMQPESQEEVPTEEIIVLATIQHINDTLEISADFSPYPGAASSNYVIQVTAFKNGSVAGQMIASNTIITGTLTYKPNKLPRITSCNTAGGPDVALGFGLDHIATFTAFDGTQLDGNHFRFAPVTPFRPVNSLSQITLRTRDVSSLTITGERSTPATPRLNISSDSQQLVLSWTDNTRLFAIESAPSLSRPFTTLTNEVDFLDNRTTLAIPINETTPRFFRLRR